MKKVLIFDDEEDILEITQIALKDHFDMYTQSSLTDPIKTVEEIDPDIILMDYSIPTIGGKKAVEILKNNNSTKDIKVIFFSANHEIPEITKESGADGYFSKPFRVNQLKKFLKEQLEEK